MVTFFSASGHVASDGDIYSVVFFVLFFAIGASLSFNVKGCAEAFYRFVVRVMPGGGGLATVGTVRVAASAIAALGLVGGVVELVDLLR
ncbi:hypothetical protein ACFQ6B_20480 [Streptomyces wedmorensis]|uniref:Uncharacterized protein n=1 Tax=Streptomyces wedmorensis TaxID=43759 RepID=A0ABW6IVN3_STRWE|nr:hypothetical protein [Streptomyces sp. SS]